MKGNEEKNNNKISIEFDVEHELINTGKIKTTLTAYGKNITSSIFVKDCEDNSFFGVANLHDLSEYSTDDLSESTDDLSEYSTDDLSESTDDLSEYSTDNSEESGYYRDSTMAIYSENIKKAKDRVIEIKGDIRSLREEMMKVRREFKEEMQPDQHIDEFKNYVKIRMKVG